MMPVAADLDDLRIDRSAARSGPLRWILAALVLLALAASGAAYWWVGRPQAAPVRTTTVREVPAADRGTVLNASGYVTARRRATVSSKITGKVVEVNVEEGMAVRRGQVLARLDDSIARAQLALAQAELDASRSQLAETEVRLAEATLNLDRQRQLVKEGVVGQQLLDTAQAERDSLAARIALGREQIAVAERQLALQRTAIEDLTIRAPFDGIAISKDAQPGEMVSPVSAGGGFTRTGICTIVDMSSLEIEVDVNENYINRVRPGQRVTAVLDAYPDWRIPARVITTIPAADRQKATVLVRIGFDALDPRILPDMGVKVAFLDEEPAGGAPPAATFLVPKQAVRAEDDARIVFVVRGDRVERRAVRVGAEQGDQIEILSGLTPGEQIVSAPPAAMADGDRVTVSR
jgi:RND family efflux transporter MFP subunit